jgi:hypothetical protein
MKFATARLALLALPLTLGLAACGKKDDAGGPAAQSAQALPTVAAPAGKAWSDVVSKTTDGGYVMGNPDAPIKLIEFGSLTCPHCAEFEEKGFPSCAKLCQQRPRQPGIPQLRARSVRHDDGHADPLRHARQLLCADPAGLCQPEGPLRQAAARRQEIQAMNLPPDKLFGVMADKGGLIDFFGARGIARDQALACLANTKTAKRWPATPRPPATSTTFRARPTFIVNGKNVDVATWEQLEPILQRAGAR